MNRLEQIRVEATPPRTSSTRLERRQFAIATGNGNALGEPDRSRAHRQVKDQLLCAKLRTHFGQVPLCLSEFGRIRAGSQLDGAQGPCLRQVPRRQARVSPAAGSRWTRRTLGHSNERSQLLCQRAITLAFRLGKLGTHHVQRKSALLGGRSTRLPGPACPEHGYQQAQPSHLFRILRCLCSAQLVLQHLHRAELRQLRARGRGSGSRARQRRIPVGLNPFGAVPPKQPLDQLSPGRQHWRDGTSPEPWLLHGLDGLRVDGECALHDEPSLIIESAQTGWGRRLWCLPMHVRHQEEHGQRSQQVAGRAAAPGSPHFGRLSWGHRALRNPSRGGWALASSNARLANSLFRSLRSSA